MTRPFWERLTLEEMSDSEWESLCDGCGRCCLLRFEDDSPEGVFYTRAACRLLDTSTCRCTDYDNRYARVSGCLSVRRLSRGEYGWLPSTCAYRLLAEGGTLPWWHPLVSGDPATVVDAGVSVAGRVVSEDNVHPAELEWLVLRD